MTCFRLDQEPWIPVLLQSGDYAELSLLETFRRAAEIRCLAGTPVEVVSLTRFLLAIAHVVETPASTNDWARLWQNPEAFCLRCADYVRSQGDVWDLLHPQRPFLQDAHLQKTKNPAHILVYDAARKNNPVWSDHSMASSPEPVPLARLARGILASNAYAGSSGGGYRKGPLCARSVLLADGESLAETILLNLKYDRNHTPEQIDWTALGAGRPRPSPRMGIAARYLWNSRRVRILPDDAHPGAARWVMLSPGNEMPEELAQEDPMVLLRQDAKGAKWVAVRLGPTEALWRQFPNLFVRHDGVVRHPILRMMETLAEKDALEGDRKLSLRICVVSADAQGPTTEFWRNELLPFQPTVLLDQARSASIERCVRAAESEAIQAKAEIYRFAQRYLAAGSESNASSDDARRLRDELACDLEPYWAELAPLGERLAVEAIDEAEWVETCRRARRRMVEWAVDRLPPTARRLRAQFAVGRSQAT
ncbi:MAG: type I-E CRISPR-associated protein Cse1/CasA [Fimbriimonadales bacterium]|nr:type I-E CRISPR-associated protein Cse1/CasA [Fimbriimonadales bacterium]